MNRDVIFDLIEKERQRQSLGVELIASENFVSENVLKSTGSVLTNKYAEGYPGRRYYGGCEVVDQVEQLAIDRAKKLFNVEYANVQPHSGSQANAAVFLACVKPGDSVLGLDLSHGGHLTHGSPVSFSGILHNAKSYGVHPETGLIDYEAMKRTAQIERPKLIIVGGSSYSRDFDYAKFREAADEVGAILWADIAHPAGLIAKGLLNDPFEYCHIVTTTTHKTLRGPRGGMILMGKDFPNPFGIKTVKGEVKMMSQVLDSAVFPGIQGGPLEHVIAAKAVSFQEAIDPGFQCYAKQILLNAKTLSDSLTQKGFNVVSGGTDNHLMLIDLRNKRISGKEAEKTLQQVDITCNKNSVPFDDKPPFISSGIRLGTPAITTRGLKEVDMAQLAELISRAVDSANDSSTLKTIKNEVNKLMRDRPLFVHH